MRTEPYRCHPCSSIIVETDDGNVQGFVGALRFPQDVEPPACPECGKPMTPVASSQHEDQVERDNGDAAKAA